MPRSQANVLLGLAVALALLTGTLAFGTGSPPWGWVLAVVHGVLGLVLVVLAVRKSRIVRSGWAAGRPSRWGGAALASVAVLAVASGVAQALGFRDLGPVSAVQVHVPSAIATGVGVVWHTVVHPAPLRRALAGRRAALRALGVLTGAAVAWTTVEAVAWTRRGFEGRRRFTGSQELPQPLVTQWFDDPVRGLDPDAWRLALADADGLRHLSRADLEGHPAAAGLTAVLDCTGGWWATTTWMAVPLDALVRPGPDDRSVVVTSATGYRRRLPIADLAHAHLATHLDSRPLPAGHGAPARLVVPGRRGFWWVKWVVEIRTSPASWLAQPPFPLT